MGADIGERFVPFDIRYFSRCEPGCADVRKDCRLPDNPCLDLRTAEGSGDCGKAGAANEVVEPLLLVPDIEGGVEIFPARRFLVTHSCRQIGLEPEVREI